MVWRKSADDGESLLGIVVDPTKSVDDAMQMTIFGICVATMLQGGGSFFTRRDFLRIYDFLNNFFVKLFINHYDKFFLAII